MRHSYTFLLATLALVSVLSACGGGGGGAPKSDDPDNVAPKITSAASVSVAENSTAVLNLTAIDPEGDTISFSITGGDDQSLFSLGGSALSFASAPDFENPEDANTDNDYQLEVTATASGQTTAQNITVTVTDVYEGYEGQVQPALNDTGITLCGDWTGDGSTSKNNIDCIAGGATTTSMPDKQDAHLGRDYQQQQGTLDKTGAGDTGFDFTKLDSDGSVLADQSVTDHHCVSDNHTGLTWEVKQNSGLHNKGDFYTWYNTDSERNGGHAGAENNSVDCYGISAGDSTTYCNTQAFVARVNAAGLCGANDWRLPTREELLSIIHYGRAEPSIDPDYFPNTQNNRYWSSSPRAGYVGGAWRIYFDVGDFFSGDKSAPGYVRLVRTVAP